MLKIRPVCQRIYDNMLLDGPLSPAEIVDFAVDSVDHHRALQIAVRAGATVEDIDDACGTGKKISALVARYAPQYAHLDFTTAYDEMRDEMDI